MRFISRSYENRSIIETFRFEDVNDYEDEIWFKDFSSIVEKIDTPEFFTVLFFLAEKLALLSILKEVKTSPDCKKLKLLTFDNLLF